MTAETALVLADPRGRRAPQTVPLEGNDEPEAFSLAGDRLFVVQHLPALAPDRYRVRTVDLARGAVGPVLSRDKQPVAAAEELRGRGRTHVLAPALNVLYTLYIHHGDRLHTRDLPEPSWASPRCPRARPEPGVTLPPHSSHSSHSSPLLPTRPAGSPAGPGVPHSERG